LFQHLSNDKLRTLKVEKVAIKVSKKMVKYFYYPKNEFLRYKTHLKRQVLEVSFYFRGVFLRKNTPLSIFQLRTIGFQLLKTNFN
jgi:hypothetical protein